MITLVGRRETDADCYPLLIKRRSRDYVLNGWRRVARIAWIYDPIRSVKSEDGNKNFYWYHTSFQQQQCGSLETRRRLWCKYCLLLSLMVEWKEVKKNNVDLSTVRLSPPPRHLIQKWWRRRRRRELVERYYYLVILSNRYQLMYNEMYYCLCVYVW